MSILEIVLYVTISLAVVIYGIILFVSKKSKKKKTKEELDNE